MNWAGIWFLVLLLTPPAAPVEPLRVMGHLANPRLTEISGIAHSGRDPGLLWAINDSGNAPLLFALGHDGADRGAVRVLGARNRDWEDIAAFRAGDIDYLLIADSGDNQGRHAVSTLIVLVEPEPGEQGQYGGQVRVTHQIPFRFEGGPQDCEAVAVDAISQSIVLIGKREVPAPVYLLPLDIETPKDQPLTARRVGAVAALPRPTPRELLEAPLGAWRHQPTALDISGDGVLAVLATYQNLYFFNRDPRQGWDEALAKTPRVVKLPLSQVEAVAIAGAAVIAVAEGRGAPLLQSGLPQGAGL